MRIEIKVFPSSSREGIVRKDGRVKIYVKAAPEKGKANDAVLKLVAKEQGVKKGNVRIVSGHASRKKVLEII